MTLTIAVLGQDERAAAMVGETLKSLGFQVAKAVTESVDVVVIDHTDPSSLIVLIKEISETLPVVALGSGSVADADLVLPKPVRAVLLGQQIEAVAARSGLAFGPWRFYPKIRLLKNANGDSEPLTEKESDLLDYLFQADRLVPREELLSEVFGYSAQVSTHTVETHIHTLRKKLGADLLITDELGYGLRVSP